jgi:SAM-dependent methyltransferase
MFSIEFLKEIRGAEIERIVQHFHSGARILEIGAGTGQQALELSNRGFNVEAIEIPDSLYAAARLFPIKDYDGLTIPFPNCSFDIVFSSNVLEHVSVLPQIHSEIARVLKPDGYAVHVLPTHAWRFWTTLSAFPVAIQYIRTLKSQVLPRRPLGRAELGRVRRVWREIRRHLMSPFRQGRHGERGDILSETWLFHPSWWRKNFAANGFLIDREFPMELFYTGNMVMGRRLNIRTRTRLAAYLGSACHLFVLRDAKAHLRPAKDLAVEKPVKE